MDRDQALLRLATTHAVALRLKALGASNETIGAVLAVPIQSVPSLITIAEAKLTAVLDAADADVVDVTEARSTLDVSAPRHSAEDDS